MLKRTVQKMKMNTEVVLWVAWNGDLEIFKLNVVVDKVPLKTFIEKSKEHPDNALGKVNLF